MSGCLLTCRLLAERNIMHMVVLSEIDDDWTIYMYPAGKKGEFVSINRESLVHEQDWLLMPVVNEVAS